MWFTVMFGWLSDRLCWDYRDAVCFILLEFDMLFGFECWVTWVWFYYFDWFACLLGFGFFGWLVGFGFICYVLVTTCDACVFLIGLWVLIWVLVCLRVAWMWFWDVVVWLNNLFVGNCWFEILIVCFCLFACLIWISGYGCVLIWLLRAMCFDGVGTYVLTWSC